MNYSVRMLSVVSGITIVWSSVSAILMEFPTVLKPVFQEYPNLTCSLMRGEIMSEMIILNFAVIQALRVFLAYDSYTFVALNHEKAFRIILVIFWGIFVSENIFCITYYGTLCTNVKVKRMLSVHKVDNLEGLKQSPPIWLSFALIMLIASMAFAILKKIRYKGQPKVTLSLNSSRSIKITHIPTNPSQSLRLGKPNSVFTISQTQARLPSCPSTEVYLEDMPTQNNQIKAINASPNQLDIKGLNQLSDGAMITNKDPTQTAMKQAWTTTEEKSSKLGNLVIFNIFLAKPVNKS